jgi:hypothetical protein
MPSNIQNPANKVSETSVPASAAPQVPVTVRNSHCLGARGARLPGRLVPAPQVPAYSSSSVAWEAKGRITVFVNAVPLYASRTQTQSQHQLPPPNSQVSNDTFPCIAVRPVNTSTSPTR